jgi:hypothetical protein
MRIGRQCTKVVAMPVRNLQIPDYLPLASRSADTKISSLRTDMAKNSEGAG